jgi:septum formation protein
MQIVLASKSVHRKKILEEHGYDIVVDVSHADEESVRTDDVKDYVMEVAKLKAETVAKRHRDAIIIASDTLVYFEGERIGKARNEAEARKVIWRLVGKTHEVYSGLCIINTKTGEVLQDFEISRVALKKMSDAELERYIQSGQYKNKAGCYNIDDPEFESFIEEVEGCRLNVKGLPIKKVEKMLEVIQ